MRASTAEGRLRRVVDSCSLCIPMQKMWIPASDGSGALTRFCSLLLTSVHSPAADYAYRSSSTFLAVVRSCLFRTCLFRNKPGCPLVRRDTLTYTFSTENYWVTAMQHTRATLGVQYWASIFDCLYKVHLMNDSNDSCIEWFTSTSTHRANYNYSFPSW